MEDIDCKALSRAEACLDVHTKIWDISSILVNTLASLKRATS